MAGEMDGDHPEPERLRSEQERRLDEEERLAEEAEAPAEARAHDRRADKAAYLRDKLAEQERSGDG